jgi:hypothetical protein
MSSDYDIEMTTDDTLELDTIIQESSSAISPINGVKHISDDSNHKSDLKGIQTSTAVFDPPKSGEYEIYINGQTLSINVTSSNVITDRVVDNFEDGDLSEYEDVTSEFTVQSSIVYDGSYALQVNANDGKNWIISTDGLNVYPKAGYKFQYHWLSTTGSSGNADFAFGVQDSSNFYRIRKKVWSGVFSLVKIEGGSGTNLDSTSVSYSGDKWYRIVVDQWSKEGSISITIEEASSGSEVGSLSADDTSYQNGGIGFINNGNYTHYYDLVETL